MVKQLRSVLGLTRHTIEKYNMIEAGDRIAVGVSGGKDSVLLLVTLAKLRQFHTVPFSITAITLDPFFNDQKGDYSAISALCERLDVPYILKPTNIGDVVFKLREEKNPCSLCARIRRGILHNAAIEAGCNRLALGHHFDDAVETFFLNLFHEGRIGCFSPVTYLSRKNLHLIRPFALLSESEIQEEIQRLQLPVVKSKCPVDGKTERTKVKELLATLTSNQKDIKQQVMGAMQRAGLNGW